MLATAALAVLLVSCATVDKTLIGTTIMVDRLMSSWANYVTEARGTPDFPKDVLAEQENTVRILYRRYQLAWQAYDALRHMPDPEVKQDAAAELDETAQKLAATIKQSMDYGYTKHINKRDSH